MTIVPTDEEQLFAGEPLVAYLATSVDDRPHVTPVSYYYEDETMQIITTGKKVENVRQNPRVAVAIQKDVDGHPEWMVQLKGTATVLDDAEDVKVGAMNIYTKYFGENVDEWDELRKKMVRNPDDEAAVIEIDVGSVVSKRY